jgi:hypothetical protein
MSNPSSAPGSGSGAAGATAPTGTANPSGTVSASTSTASVTSSGTTSSSSTSSHVMPSFSANDIPLTERYISDHSWPSTLVLDLRSSNWSEWSHRLETLASRTGLDPWLNGSLSPPDPNLKIANSWVWWTNNNSLRGFIIQHISTQNPAFFVLAKLYRPSLPQTLLLLLLLPRLRCTHLYPYLPKSRQNYHHFHRCRSNRLLNQSFTLNIISLYFLLFFRILIHTILFTFLQLHICLSYQVRLLATTLRPTCRFLHPPLLLLLPRICLLFLP